MVCSRRVTGPRSGKRAGSSTYWKKVGQGGGVSGSRRNSGGIRLTGGYLLQGCGAELDGDVGEEAVSLCAEIPDDVRVCVGRSEELHFTFRDLHALRQDSLHGDVAAVKVAPEAVKQRRSTSRERPTAHVTAGGLTKRT